MMFKATLTAATLLASTAALSQQDVSKAVSLTAKKAKTQLKASQTAQHAKILSAVKDFKLANKGVALSALSVSNKRGIVGAAPIRTLRGKGGKGKGKGKDEEVGGVGGDSTATTKYLQLSLGYCAGTDMGLGPIAEDVYFLHDQSKSGTCYNSIDADGSGYSSAYDGTAEPFAISRKAYIDHDCMEENFIGEVDVTDMFFGGAITPSDSCTDTGMGFGARYGIFETSFAVPTRAIIKAGGPSLAECRSGAGNLAMYNSIYIEPAELSIYGEYSSMCNSDDGVTSYIYDVSNCGTETPSLTMNMFSDYDCTVPSGSLVKEPEICVFDYEFFVGEIRDYGSVDFFYDVKNCYA